MGKLDFAEIMGFKKSTNTSAPDVNKLYVQSWMPLVDIQDKYAIRRDGKLVGFLKVYPIDLSLMSEKEKRRIIQAFKEAINSEKDQFEIFTIPRPVDLETYLSELNGIVASTGNPMRRLILRDSIEFAVKMVSSGSCVERQYFIIATQDKGKRAEEDLLNRLNELSIKLRAANLRADICNDMDIMNVCALYATPQTSSVMSKAQEISLIPMYDEGV
jgi:hypothetical protein